MKFADLRLSRALLDTIAAEGYHTATPIQAKTIPAILDGRDVLGCAQTGTGKTAAFALPLLHRLAEAHHGKGRRRARTLVLAPTRELAEQIADSFKTYGRKLELRGTMVFGGVGQGPQVDALRKGVDIVVATPGRLLDLINQGHCDLSGIEYLVLDEADRMLDMGFMPDIKRIISHLPGKRQTLLFSATMPDEIRKLAAALLHKPVEATIAPQSPAVERIAQSVYHVSKTEKPALLARLMDTLPVSRAIVFTRTKHGADRVVRQLKRGGTVAEAIHGNKSQNARRRALGRFKDNAVHVLVATDIAARGIDVDDISHVFNYDLSREPENHVHRIGRTARAGAEGAAISFCDADELPHLRAIEKLLRTKIQVIGAEPDFARATRPAKAKHPARAAAQKSGEPGGGKKRRRRGPGASANHPGGSRSGRTGKPRGGPRRAKRAAQ